MSCLLLLHKTPCGRQSSSLCPDAPCPLDPPSAATLLSIGPRFPGPSHFPGLLRDLPGFPERGNDPLPWSSGCAAGSPGLSANVLVTTEWCPSAPGSDLGVQQPLPAHICSSARAACPTLSSYLRGLLITCPNLISPGEKNLRRRTHSGFGVGVHRPGPQFCPARSLPHRMLRSIRVEKRQ